MASPPASDWGDEIEVDDELLVRLAAVEERHLARAHIAIEFEPPPETPTSSSRAEASEPKLSLLEQYRRRGTLSVTDLVSPLWCEQLLSYRLASQSHLPPERRPASIVTASGSTIVLDGPRTVHREAVLDKGRVVHRVLEVQVMGDQAEVQVDVTGGEEEIALRILNTLVCLIALVETGQTAEIPVFGFVDGVLVFGKIDGIERRMRPTRPSPPSPSSSRPLVFTTAPTNGTSPSPRTTTDVAPDQTRLDAFFSPVASPRTKGKEKEVAEDDLWGYVLIDTKTRYNHSLPPKADSRSSRLQTMVYHRFLSSLLTAPLPPEAGPPPPTRPTPFPWDDFYATRSLSPTLHFSRPFISSIKPILMGSSLDVFLGEATTLAEFVATLQLFGELLGLSETKGPLDDTLEISYRLRNTVTRKWAPKKTTLPDRKTPPLEETHEDEPNARAAKRARSATNLVSTASPPLPTPFVGRLASPPPPPRVPSPSAPPEEILEGTLIGVEQFQYDGVELSAHLTDVLQLWRGEREPRGVGIENTGRCRNCEFEDGCEWRAAKALAALERTRAIASLRR